MAHLFRDLTLGQSKRDTTPSPPPPPITPLRPTTVTAADNLPSPLGQISVNFSDSDLTITAYEIFVAACRTSAGKPLSFVPNNQSSDSLSHNSPNSLAYQRSLTYTAASKVKKAFGLKSPGSGSKKSPGSGPGKPKRPVTVGELMRNQMRVSEAMDSRVRRALLRISAGQVGRRIESVVVPLELLQQLKVSDFADRQEYEEWQKRTLKVLEAGLILHPHLPLDKSNSAAQRLRQIIHGALDRPIETGRNNESMQVLRSAVMSLANRSYDGSLSDSCHWADGIPLNLRLYEMLLQSCFDANDESSIIEEFDELMEQIKKTWGILGLNQTLHNLCFTWVLFHRFVATGQMDLELLSAADGQLAEVAKDAKTTKDSEYSQILSSTLTSIMGWAEKRLLAYHETFDRVNVETMEGIVSLGVAAAKILVEDISNEYRRRRRTEVNVALKGDKFEMYRLLGWLHESMIMEKADSSRRASKNQPNALPLLAILAKDVGSLAVNEKQVFSPILKRWHPLAAGLAVATLHVGYGNELKQFISGITELTPDVVQVLRAADQLEKDLVQIAVEDSVESDDGGKAIIREMPPYEAEATIANLVKIWIKSRLDKLKEWVDRNLQQELWSPQTNQEGCAPSAVEALRTVNETLDAFFQLPIPMHPALLPEVMNGLDRCIQYYVAKAKSGCGSRNTFLPTMPALTRCTIGSKFQGFGKKKDKSPNSQKRNPQVATNGDSSFGIPQLCVRINTLQWVLGEFDVLEKRIITLLRNSESARVEDFSNGLAKKFELYPAACLEGIQQLCEAAAYRLVFHNLSHALWDGLYVGDPSSSRIDPFLQELERNLMFISDTINEKIRTRILTEIMRASFDGFLLVLLAGGPSRSFSQKDCQIIEDDFEVLKEMFWANGDGLPSELIDKFSTTVRSVLPLFRTETDSLIERFRRVTSERYKSNGRTKLPLPPTSGQWDPSEPNTLLRVLCYRNDESATRFLKKTYDLPKKL
ncbi:hypothetical protein TanjilG_12562 [Lupinus angustifolius]|uniref:MHD1 domain-containing protein n=1 Tax=Lupinus angustifolius TaxID=3871 RepID=A0A4P1QYT9_LUPAN|nr:hypothetical protein TanjilG_12562 [Lupinus angustifolius]